MLLVRCSSDQHSTIAAPGVWHAVAAADHMLRRGSSHTERLQAIRPRVLHYSSFDNHDLSHELQFQLYIQSVHGLLLCLLILTPLVVQKLTIVHMQYYAYYETTEATIEAIS